MFASHLRLLLPCRRGVSFAAQLLPRQQRQLSGTVSTSLKDFELKFQDLNSNIETKLKNRNVLTDLEKLEQELAREDLWDDAARANRISREHGALKDIVDRCKRVKSESENSIELASMALTEDESVAEECLSELDALFKEASSLHLELLLDGPADKQGCFVEVKAGAGGAEACDFTEVLLNMYHRWCEAKGYSCEITDTSPGEVGLRHGVLKVSGLNAFGWMKLESGVHRMVRISEYDTSGRRHTCFAQVGILPCADDDGAGDDVNSIEIPPQDLKIETYRSSGPGGQHAQKTDSAVRLTHIPTGVNASCQSSRVQVQNKNSAMAVLKARLLERKLEESRKARGEFLDTLGENTWGNQVRSYVLHPYKMVKDHRTQHETAQAVQMLQGDPNIVTPFMEAALLDPNLQS